MTNSKILNMYHLLTDVYHARVEKVAAQPAKGEQRTLIITLTVDGQPEVFNSKSEDYELLLVKLARRDFNEPFTSANISELNRRLETIATTFRPT